MSGWDEMAPPLPEDEQLWVEAAVALCSREAVESVRAMAELLEAGEAVDELDLRCLREARDGIDAILGRKA